MKHRIIGLLASLIVGTLLGWLFRQRPEAFRRSRTNEDLFPSLATYYDVAAGTDYDAKEDAWSIVMQEVVDKCCGLTELERKNVHRMLTRGKPNFFDYSKWMDSLTQEEIDDLAHGRWKD